MFCGNIPSFSSVISGTIDEIKKYDSLNTSTGSDVQQKQLYCRISIGVRFLIKMCLREGKKPHIIILQLMQLRSESRKVPVRSFTCNSKQN